VKSLRNYDDGGFGTGDCQQTSGFQPEVGYSLAGEIFLLTKRTKEVKNPNFQDNVVAAMYASSGQEQKMAQEVLTTLKEHPDAWTKVRLNEN
jgi:hypothetical protein